MFRNMMDKLQSKKGGGKAVLLSGLLFSYFLIFYIIIDRDNEHYRWTINNAEMGLRSGAKAALQQIDIHLQYNIESIADGYYFQETEYNHFVFLDHAKANDVFFKILRIAMKNNYTIEELKNYTKIAIIEPERSLGSWRYLLTIYHKDAPIEQATFNHMSSIQDRVNAYMETIKISLNSEENPMVRTLYPRTYYIAIIENMPIKNSYIFSEKRLIDLYYFEGANLMRSKHFREGN